jgi:hypothetical protein
MILNVLGHLGFREGEGIPALCSLRAKITHPESSPYADKLRHVLRQGAVFDKSYFDTIHTIGLGLAKRIIAKTVPLLQTYGEIGDTNEAKKKIKSLRDNLVSLVDERLQGDSLTWMQSETSGTLIRSVSKSIKRFANMTAKEYQYAVQKLLFVLGPGDVPSKLLPKEIADPFRRLLMMLNDLLMYSSFMEWDLTGHLRVRLSMSRLRMICFTEELFLYTLQVAEICKNLSDTYINVFRRISVFRKKKNGKLIEVDIDTCRFPKLHNISHCERDSIELGIPVFNDTTNGERGMPLVRQAFKHTQRRNDDSTDFQILFYVSYSKILRCCAESALR